MMKEIVITIFTPAYNRANLLKVLYDSIKKQKFKNFEWLIVDDGSSDNTKDVVDDFIAEKIVNIKYIYQKNAGKHIAINTGVKNAKGKYFFIVDSDDYIVDNVLAKIDELFKSIANNDGYAGIAGTKIFKDGTLIGKTFNDEFIDCTTLERKKYNILGDKAEVFYTEILKKYPFPKIDNEKFLPEAYIWNKIAYDGFKIRWTNNPFIVCEYLQDGLTKNASKLVDNNYNGQLLYLKDLIKYDNSLMGKIAHYSSYCGIAKNHYNIKFIKDELHINILLIWFYLLIYNIRRG